MTAQQGKRSLLRRRKHRRAGLCALALLCAAQAASAQEDDIIKQLTALQNAFSGKGSAPDELVDHVLTTLGTSMGLPPKRRIRVEEAERSSLKRTLTAVLDEQYPGKTLEYMNHAFQLIGLMPPGSDLRAEAVTLYQSQVAGFYDPRRGRLVLIRGQAPMQQLPVLQHELAHALQDQHYPIQKMIERVSGDEDRALALQAVLEGQAMLAMFAASGLVPDPQQRQQLEEVLGFIDGGPLAGLAGAGGGGLLQSLLGENASLASLILPANTGPLAQASPYLQAQLLFPYQEGTRFMEELCATESFARVVRRTLENPPESTEQVLHADAYRRWERPIAVDLKLLRRMPGWRLLYSTTVGELNIRTLFGGRGRGEQGAAGWGGDTLLYMQRTTGRTMAAWMTAWDTPNDAAEFFVHLAATLGGRPGMTPLLVDRDHFVGQRTTGLTVIKRIDAHVGVLADAPVQNSSLQLLYAALWHGIE